MRTTLLLRFPKVDQILPVFAVIAFFAYGRTLYTFAFKLPAWVLFLTLDEILSTLAYGLVVNLLESLAILLALLVICAILPARFFKDDFIARGAWLIVFILSSILIYFNYYSSKGPDFVDYLYPWMVVTLALAAPVAYLGGRIILLKKAAVWFADRTIIFLFLLVPASLISIVVVIVRNIFQ